MVTRSPTRQPQGQVHMVDGIVVPAWVAQEQAQQAQQQARIANAQPNPLQQDAARLAKENKMTVML